jgi:hypothetical protein
VVRREERGIREEVGGLLYPKYLFSPVLTCQETVVPEANITFVFTVGALKDWGLEPLAVAQESLGFLCMDTPLSCWSYHNPLLHRPDLHMRDRLHQPSF